MAQCASGYYPCGSDYCTPNEDVCCASVGYPQGNCPAGDTCNSNGTCNPPPASSGGAASGPQGSCDAGYYQCGTDYCTPDGDVCCASVGYPQGNCSAGNTCNANGTCSGPSSDETSSGSGATSGPQGSCSDGYYQCGADYCTPTGDVCCASVGYPQGNCPGGDTCNSNGTCSGPSSSAGSSSSGGGAGGSSPKGGCAAGRSTESPGAGIFLMLVAGLAGARRRKRALGTAAWVVCALTLGAGASACGEAAPEGSGGSTSDVATSTALSTEMARPNNLRPGAHTMEIVRINNLRPVPPAAETMHTNVARQ
jgi:MYXO-CTERM domain-containing protein